VLRSLYAHISAGDCLVSTSNPEEIEKIVNWYPEASPEDRKRLDASWADASGWVRFHFQALLPDTNESERTGCTSQGPETIHRDNL
jgi:hypothetical protein